MHAISPRPWDYRNQSGFVKYYDQACCQMGGGGVLFGKMWISNAVALVGLA